MLSESHLFRCRAIHSQNNALLYYSLPEHISAVRCHCAGNQCYAKTTPSTANTYPSKSLPLPSHSMPKRVFAIPKRVFAVSDRSYLCHNDTCLNSTMPMLCHSTAPLLNADALRIIAIQCRNQAHPCFAQALFISALPLLRSSSHCQHSSFQCLACAHLCQDPSSLFNAFASLCPS